MSEDTIPLTEEERRQVLEDARRKAPPPAEGDEAGRPAGDGEAG